LLVTYNLGGGEGQETGTISKGSVSFNFENVGQAEAYPTTHMS
jgi:hypothetical protein